VQGQGGFQAGAGGSVLFHIQQGAQGRGFERRYSAFHQCGGRGAAAQHVGRSEGAGVQNIGDALALTVAGAHAAQSFSGPGRRFRRKQRPGGAISGRHIESPGFLIRQQTAVEQGAQQPVLKVDGQGVQQVQGLVPVHNLGADQSPEQFRRQGCGQPGLLLGRAGLRSRGGSQRRVSGGSARRRSGSGHCQGQAAQNAKKKG